MHAPFYVFNETWGIKEYREIKFNLPNALFARSQKTVIKETHQELIDALKIIYILSNIKSSYCK